MSIYQAGEKLNMHNEDGIWLDYRDHHWIFFLKDHVWDAEELQRVKKSQITITFIQKGIVDAFLLEIYDCLETSDLPFCMKDAEEELIKSLEDKKDYVCEVCILNGENVILADREIPLNHHDSQLLKQKLKDRVKEAYDSDAFDQAYQKLSVRYEPYEMEQFALFKEVK